MQPRVISGGVDQASPPSVVGSWVNQRGSHLHLEEGEGGAVHGWFQLRSQASLPVPQPVTGYTVQTGKVTLVGLCVRWPDAITVWSGRLEAGSEHLESLWITEEAVDSRIDWRDNSVGADVFQRLPG